MALAIAIPLILGVVVGGIAASLLRSPPATLAPSGPVHLYLTIAFNPGTGLDEYFPANFTVPSHRLVVVTISTYDNGTNPVSSMNAMVMGTVGGTETVTNASSPSGEVVSALPANHIGHTFTLNSPPYNINVPVPPSESTAVPVLVTFSVYFNTTGSFTWHCMAPCDPVSMTTPGFMMGTVTVEEG